jgi:fumarate reductase subunit C
MIFKVAIKIAFLALELFLGVYSLIMTDSLVMKFLFFVVSAVIVAFVIMKFTSKLLPTDIDSYPSDDIISEENIEKENIPLS